MISTQFNNFGLKSFEDAMGFESYLLTNIEGSEHIVMERDLGFNNWRIISYLQADEIYAKSREVSNTMVRVGVVFMIIAVGMGIYLTDMISRPIVEITESINRIIEEETTYKKNTMINNLSLEHLERSTNPIDGVQEPTEISNFRAAIQGFKSVLENGSRNFDIEHNQLKKNTLTICMMSWKT